MEKILSRAEIRLTGWSQPTSSILENDAPFPLYSRRKHPLDSALPPSWEPPSRLPTRSLDIQAESILMYIESNVCRVITLDTFERGKMRASDFSIYSRGGGGWISRKQSLDIWHVCISMVLCCNGDWKRVLKKREMDRALWLIDFLFRDFFFVTTRNENRFLLRYLGYIYWYRRECLKLCEWYAF